MKELIKKLLGSIGYKIEKINNPNPLTPRYEQLLKEHYGSYKHLKFTDLPNLDDSLIKLISQLDGTQISEAIYILNSLETTKTLQGAICEFGIAQGYTSALLGHSIKATKKDLWLFDSFEGLPEPTSKDKLKNDIFKLKTMEAYKGTMKHSIEKVKKNLRQVSFPEDRTHIIDGFIENTILTATLPQQVSFAFVDLDFYNPIKIALEFLDKVIVKDGIVIVDDYDFFSEGAKIAVDEFYAQHKSSYVMELPIPSAGYFALLRRIN
jgi:hypothetical protein